MAKIDLDEKHFEALGMDRRAFNIAFVKLQNEGLIDGLSTFPQVTRMEPKAVMLDSVMPTRSGLEYVEKRLDIVAMSTGKEKLKRLVERFGKLGWAVLQDMASDILSKFI